MKNSLVIYINFFTLKNSCKKWLPRLKKKKKKQFFYQKRDGYDRTLMDASIPKWLRGQFPLSKSDTIFYSFWSVPSLSVNSILLINIWVQFEWSVTHFYSLLFKKKLWGNGRRHLIDLDGWPKYNKICGWLTTKSSPGHIKIRKRYILVQNPPSSLDSSTSHKMSNHATIKVQSCYYCIHVRCRLGSVFF